MMPFVQEALLRVNNSLAASIVVKAIFVMVLALIVVLAPKGLSSAMHLSQAAAFAS